jgi:hypothetical protein
MPLLNAPTGVSVGSNEINATAKSATAVRCLGEKECLAEDNDRILPNYLDTPAAVIYIYRIEAAWYTSQMENYGIAIMHLPVP